jgi:hypothetical protein
MDLPKTWKCVRKLSFRWALLALVLTELALLGFYLFKGHQVTTETMIINAGQRYVLPFTMPRLLDGLFFGLTVYLFALVSFSYDMVQEHRQKRGKNGEMQSVTRLAYGWGIFFGTCGYVVVSFGGLEVAVIGTAICSFAIGYYNIYYSEFANTGIYLPARELFMIESVAIIMIWGACTLQQGALVGLVYATAMLVTAVVVHFGVVIVYYAIVGTKNAVGPTISQKFREKMLTCNPANPDC